MRRLKSTIDEIWREVRRCWELNITTLSLRCTLSPSGTARSIDSKETLQLTELKLESDRRTMGE